MRPDARLITADRAEAPVAPVPLLDGIVRYRSAGRRRIAGPRPDDLATHLARYGRRPSALGHGDELIAAMGAAALTGRGGARFPTAAKWRAVLSAGGGYVVANAAEGEPASAKDTALLQHRPHLVLDGIAVAAEALGAAGSVLWLHDTAQETRTALDRALTERRSAGLPDPPVRVMYGGPEHYLTGESSAILNGLAGGPVLPTFRRVPAARAGLAGRPTLVQNVETLARVALLARGGPEAPAGGPLVTVVAGQLLLVCQPPPHVTLDGLLWHLGALRPGAGRPEAALLGGYGGAWATWSSVAGQTLGRLDRGLRLDRNGPTLSLGAGVIAPLPPDTCGLGETAAVLNYLARSSARQCGPCLFGTRDLADTMARLATGRARRADIDRLHRLVGEVDGRGACALPDGAAQLTRTALAVFHDDLNQHRRGHCRHHGGSAGLPIPGGTA